MILSVPLFLQYNIIITGVSKRPNYVNETQTRRDGGEKGIALERSYTFSCRHHALFREELIVHSRSWTSIINCTILEKPQAFNATGNWIFITFAQEQQEPLETEFVANSVS